MAQEINKNLEIAFVTSNNIKFKQVSSWLSKLNPRITLKQVELDLPEYQSLDLTYVAQEKAQCAWNKIRMPLLIDDGGIYLNAYNNFPGTLSRYVFDGIGLTGFLKLAEEDNRAHFKTQLVFTKDGVNYTHFEGQLNGKIVNAPEALKTDRMPFTLVFIPNGYDKTLKQLQDEIEVPEFTHRYQAVKKFAKFLS